MNKTINIIGAGLAGVDAAFAAAEAGRQVRLFEMKPAKKSSAHKSDLFAELVCSNSLRSNDAANAAGLLKEEMRALGSLVIMAADETSVPAGKALAVDRKLFSEFIEEKINKHPNIEVVHEEVTSLKDMRTPTVVASGPLTSEDLSVSIAEVVGQDYLYFYDSVSPIIDSDSLNFEIGFKASRYGYGGDDYLNFALTKEQYDEFQMDLLLAEKVEVREFEKPKYFEGCLPIEVMSERGLETLRHGPMKPFGIRDPKTGDEPYAIIQLRQEDRERSMWNMVGFQTRMKWGEQEKVFRKIPGLEKAKFLRYGVIHRNTYINSPGILDEHLRLKMRPGLIFAGQITGVEGYIESAATGLWVGTYLGLLGNGKEPPPPPPTTAIGSLIWHVVNPNHRSFQPMNVNFGLMPMFKEKVKKKDRKPKMVVRAKADFAAWLDLI